MKIYFPAAENIKMAVFYIVTPCSFGSHRHFNRNILYSCSGIKEEGGIRYVRNVDLLSSRPQKTWCSIWTWQSTSKRFPVIRSCMPSLAHLVVPCIRHHRLLQDGRRASPDNETRCSDYITKYVENKIYKFVSIECESRNAAKLIN
jgi:hypothetical protein